MMGKPTILCAAFAVLCLLSACTAQAPSSVSPPPAEPPPAADTAPENAVPDAELESAAAALLQSMKAGDFSAVAEWVDGDKGVTFTPYSTVDPTRDRCLTAEEVAALGTDETVYDWGRFDGSGEPIALTGRDYWDRFVWNADYTAAPTVTVQGVARAGNVPENVDEAYPADGQFSYVEYHYDGLDPQYGGLDWCSLKLVFLRQGDAWKLVGLIHSQTTI